MDIGITKKKSIFKKLYFLHLQFKNSIFYASSIKKYKYFLHFQKIKFSAFSI